MKATVVLHGLGLAAVGVAGAFAWLSPPRIPLRTFASRPALAPTVAEPAADSSGILARASHRWVADLEDDWACDLFTPPSIRRDPVSGEFRVPPRRPVERRNDDEPEIQLLEVLQPVFRVQLVGYVGQAGQWLGIFEEAATGETQLARAGQTLGRLGVRVEAIRVERAPESSTGAPPLAGWVATADVIDDWSGSRVALSTQMRRTSAPVRARLRWRATGQEWEQEVGSAHVVDGGFVRVRSIEAHPPRALIVREVPGRAACSHWSSVGTD